MEKPDFKQAAIAYANDGTWGYPIEGDEPGEMMFREISRAHQDGCEHVWNTHVVPLQDKNKIMFENGGKLTTKVLQLESENKALREEIERLKAEQKGTVPRMFRCSSTGCTWPNCDCGKL